VGQAQNGEVAKEWQHPALVAWQKRSLPEAATAATGGDAQAQYYLAWINWFGERGQTNREQAVQWFQAAATNGVPEAQFKLGVFAERGIGQPVDLGKALEWYQKAAVRSNAVVQFKLANFNGVSNVFWPNSIIYYTNAIAQHYPRAEFYFAKQQYAATGDVAWDKFLPVCQNAAEAGVVEAQYKLASAYLGGKGVKEDHALAFKWLWLAAEYGEEQAKRYIQTENRVFSAEERKAGEIAARAFMVKPLNPEHAHWERLLYHTTDWDRVTIRDRAKKIAANGAAQQFEQGLTLCHENCVLTVPSPIVTYVNGVPQRPSDLQAVFRNDEALRWLRMAAEQHFSAAEFLLGQRLFTGAGGNMNVAEGLRWLRRAASGGQREACFLLGQYHQQLNSQQTRLAEAVRWHRLAAAGEHPLSKLWLQEFAAANHVKGTGSSGLEQSRQVKEAGNIKSQQRLAIISAQPELEDISAVITATLGESGQVVLVERGEIEKIIREQALVIDQSAGRLKLGEMLAADGVVFLERFKKSDKEWLSVQMVAVQPGVIISEQIFPWPLTDLSSRVQAVVDRQVELLPKLMIRREEAIPLSLLNFTSPLMTTNAVRLDREVTDMIARRLLSQPELFVLERRRMEQLSSEKALERNNSPFWNGSWILEGEINPEGIRMGQLTVRARLKSPAGTVKEISVTKEQNSLPGLIQDLATRISDEVQVKGVVQVWDPLAEAAQYYDETRWQLAAGVLKEAQSSAEAAWALGMKSPEMGVLRVSSYIKQLQAEEKDYAYRSNSREPSLEIPSVDSLRIILRGLVAQQEAFERLEQTDGATADAGVELLSLSMKVLKRLHDKKYLLKAQWQLLPQLRERVRGLVSCLTEHADVLTAKRGYAFRNVLLQYGGMAEETLGESLLRYDELIRKGVYFQVLPDIKDQYFNLAAWDGKNLLEMESGWETMVLRWSQDADPKIRTAAALALIDTAKSYYQVDEGLNQMAECFLQNQQMVMSGELPPALWIHAKAQWQRGEDVGLSQQEKKIWTPKREEVSKAWDQKMEALLRPAREADEDRVHPERAAKINVVRSMVDKAVAEKRAMTREDGRKIVAINFFDLKVRDVAPLIPLLAEYRKYPTIVDSAYSHLYFQMAMVYERQNQMLPSELEHPFQSNKPKDEKPKKKVTKLAPTPVRPVERFEPNTTVKIPELRAPAAMEVGELKLELPVPITLSLEVGQDDVPREFFVTDWDIADDRLWIAVQKEIGFTVAHANGGRFETRYINALIEIDMRKGLVLGKHLVSTNRLRFPENQYPPPQYQPQGKFFAVLPQDIFWIEEGRLLQRKTPNGAWTDTAIELPAKSRLSKVGTRLFVLAPETLFEIDPKTKATHVLASSRRRPAQTSMDEVPDLSSVLLFAGPQKALRAAVGKKIFFLNEKAEKWEDLLDLSDHKKLWFSNHDDELIIENVGSYDWAGAWLQNLSKDATNIVNLVQGIQPGSFQWSAPKDMASRIYSWYGDSPRRTASLFDAGWSHCWNRGELWSFFDADNNLKNRTEPSLVYFKKGLRDPLVIRPVFPPVLENSELVQRPGHCEIISIESALVLIFPARMRVFFLPKEIVFNKLSVLSKVGDGVQNERKAYLERRIKYWREMFDRNHNGKLEPEENAEMLNSAQVQKDLKEAELLNANKSK